MRFTISFRINGSSLPINYRPVFISFIKNALTKYQDGKYYDTYYKNINEKPYTLAINLGPCSFHSNFIMLKSNRLKLHFSTSDIESGIHFYNAFLCQKNTPFPLPDNQSMALVGIHVEKEVTITSNAVLCTFVAPLCIRLHDKETNKDQYITCEDYNFEAELKRTLKYQISNIPYLTEKMVSDFIIVPYKCKKIMIKHYDHCIPCSIGSFILKGDIHLLTYLYQSGMSSRKSSGFGYFNILTQGGGGI